jgi:Tol biopolymer transport system component
MEHHPARPPISIMPTALPHATTRRRKQGARAPSCLSLGSGCTERMLTVCAAAVLSVLLCRCEKPADTWYPWDPMVKSVAEHPTWTPDGRTVLFESGGRIWSVDLLGNTRCVTGDWPYSVYTPDVSHDGRWLLFEREADIYKAKLKQDGTLDAASVRALTVRGRNFLPTWSPGDLCIAYDSDVVGDTTGYFGVALMDSSGSNKRRMPGMDSGGRAPSWSPGGERVVYVGWANHYTAELFTADTSGGNRHRVTSDTVEDWRPCWSPDGSRIAFGRYPQSGGQAAPGIRVCIIDTAGTKLEVVAVGLDPRWSPDGTMLAFMDIALDDEGSPYTTVFVIDLQTMERKQLVWK